MAKNEQKSEEMKQIEGLSKAVEKAESSDLPVNNDPSISIDPSLIEQLNLLVKYFNLDSINHAIAYLLGIADTLVNDDALSELVLLKSQMTDGTITEEELINYTNGNTQENMELQDNNSNVVLDILEQFVPGSKDRMGEFAEYISANNPDAVNDVPMFVSELQKFLGPQGDMEGLVEGAAGALEDKLSEDNKEDDKALAKVKVISLTGEDNKKDSDKKDMPYGADEWLRAAFKN